MKQRHSRTSSEGRPPELVVECRSLCAVYPVPSLGPARRSDGPPQVPSASGRCLRPPGLGLASEVGGRRGLVRLKKVAL